ncbi:low-affinity hexose transporter hxt3 [Trichoderma arundinaceum]|uniref:Low-affinity hexose transporter hxt3 n=1 Tax=Trichoderma arundinaceum TaxID=490622 RepID=A0A395NWL6_TRIAR|nr:low-affinity hexose transporter hxt3 [Trichoderma arundinaceum]
MFGHRSFKVNGVDCGLDALFLAIITSIAGFLFGYDIGQISGILLFNNFVDRFLSNGSATTKSLLVSFMSIGCLFGSLLGAYTSDWLGRRKSIALGVIIFIAGDIIQVIAASSWVHVTMGRFVSGIGIGNLSVGVPMFQSECVPREIRGAVVTSYQLLITIGILFGNLVECFSPTSKVPKTQYRTLLGMGIHFLQQWTGVNYFFYYGASIFSSAKINDPLMTQLVLGAVNVGTTFVAVYFVDKLGRRWPLIVGALWQAAWLLVFASIGTVSNHAPSETFGIIMIFSACMFIASFAATWGPIAWVVMGETFALRTRAKQASLATASNWLGNFLIGLLTPFADYSISYSFGFILASANLVAAFLVWFYLYESLLLSLESVDIMYSIQNLMPWESARWVPPGYVTRLERDEKHFRRMSISAADMSGLTQEMVDMVNRDVGVKSGEDDA